MTNWIERLLSADRERPRRLAQLHAETVVNAPLDETFAFFANASNLERLTPLWLQFSFQSPLPLVMREGVEIAYQIRVHGVPIPWRTRIEVWEPKVRFVDSQLTGPYRWWRHEHRFQAAGECTRVIDRVEYIPRIAWLTAGFVRRDVERIFNHRQATLRQLFGDDASREQPDRRRLAEHG